jgi:hypothetical protein
MEPFFIVCREVNPDGSRWAYIDKCPHGSDLGSILFGPTTMETENKGWTKRVWQWEDLGNGRCRISPSILALGVHGGSDCHFGPGEFDFIYLEDGEYRNTEPFLSRYNARRSNKLSNVQSNSPDRDSSQTPGDKGG